MTHSKSHTILFPGRVQTFTVLTVLLFLAATMATAQTETVLYSFTGLADGSRPYDGLVIDAQGNLYGTTYEGGNTCNSLPYSCGTVFEVTPAGTETVVYAFKAGSGAHDGYWPLAGLTMDEKGDLYGTTQYGSSGGAGTVFEVQPGGREGLLHGFGGTADGLYPQAGLVRDHLGNLYGTTFYGIVGICGVGLGNPGCGTVFKVTPSGTETVLYNFVGPPDGLYADANLILDEEGNLYGTTSSGGAVENSNCPYGCGTIFEITPSGTETVLYSFTGGADGSGPAGGLLRDARGNLFGTTTGGGFFGVGCGAGCGTVFELTTGGTLTVLHDFTGVPDGSGPFGGLVGSSKGVLYGTTEEGGAIGAGTVFEVSLSGKEKVIYSFAGGPTDGLSPRAGLVMDKQGNLYGTTTYGGPSGNGTVFKVIP